MTDALARAEETVRHLSARLSVLNEVSRAFGEATVDYGRLLDLVARRTSEIMDSPCVVRLVSDDGAWLPLAAIHHSDPEWVAAARAVDAAHPQPVTEGFSGAIVQGGEPMLIPELSPEAMIAGTRREHRPLFESFPFYSVVGAPMRSYGRVIGMMMLARHVPGRPFTPDDMAFVQDLAERAALAITNARLIEALRREREATEQRVIERTEALERSNSELSEFAYVASHDLQEPLRKINAFGDMLAEAAGPGLAPEAAEHLARMQSAARRMQSLINDLLAFSRVTSRARTFARVDLGAVAREVLQDMEARIRESAATVTLGALPVLEADPLQMRQLLQNLLSNAIKFHREGIAPVVLIRAGDPSAPRCELRVEDNGIGFDERYLDRIFKPFQRLHNASAYEGTGIGLAICRRIVERHDGTLGATSAPGKGAAFIASLPWKHDRTSR